MGVGVRSFFLQGEARYLYCVEESYKASDFRVWS